MQVQCRLLPFALMRGFRARRADNYSELVMVVHPSPDLRELIACAKARPGELNYASSGAGTPTTWAAEPFKALSGTNLIHVPHKASGEARNSVIGGHVQMMFDEFLRADIENWARVTKVSGMQTR
jgi:hypothetical protein